MKLGGLETKKKKKKIEHLAFFQKISRTTIMSKNHVKDILKHYSFIPKKHAI